MLKTSSRNYIWDIFRGGATLLVLFHHYSYRYDVLFGHNVSWPIQTSISLGSFGVCIFFILTGFFIIPSIESSTSFLNYLKKRAIRLYPAYIPCVIITMLLMTVAPPLGERNVTLVEFLVNLTMFQSFLGVNSVDGAYWTLAHQIMVYVGFAGLYFFFKKNVTKFLLSLLFWMFLGVLLFIINKSTGFSHGVFLSNSEYIGVFIQGVVLYCLKSKIGNKFCLYSFLFISIIYGLLYLPIEYVIFNFLIVLLMVLIIERKVEVNRKGLLVFIGGVSYPLYLLHQNIGFLIIRFLEINLGLKGEWIIIIPIGILVLFAYLLSTYVEKPIGKCLKSL